MICSLYHGECANKIKVWILQPNRIIYVPFQLYNKSKWFDTCWDHKTPFLVTNILESRDLSNVYVWIPGRGAWERKKKKQKQKQ